MKIVRIKYIPPLGPLVQDLERIFPEYAPITAALIDSLGGILINSTKKRFVFVKEFRNPDTGVRTHVIVYALVRDSFAVPIWVQGVELSDVDVSNPINHHFLGHEQRVMDDPNEAPEVIIT